MIKYPRLFELNVRSWANSNGIEKLSDVPQKYIRQWASKGFDMVWLMGIWKANPHAIKKYCFEPELIALYNSALKDWTEKDVIGSPYSIDKYEVNQALGNFDDLLQLKKRLNEKGIKLILDFVPNHFSVESSLISSNKELFLPADEFLFRNDPYTFFKSNSNPNDYFAHGRDPLFPPWKDTIQVNFYSHLAREFLINTLLHISDYCDGVRCDMAMLPLNNVFYNTWIGVIKKYGMERPKKEFWEEAICAVKKKRKDFIFIAEAYWDLEWQLQQLGFDFTYDKRLTDRLAVGDVKSVKDHLNAEQDYQNKSVRFLENHDEDRAITKFGRERSLAAATIISTIQGLIFYFDGQIEAKKTKLPVQLGRGPIEKIDKYVFDYYHKLLEITKDTVFKNGNWKMIEPLPASQNDFSYENILAWQWTKDNESRIVVINYSNSTSRCRLKYELKSELNEITLNDLLNENLYNRSRNELMEKGLFIELKAYNSHIFACQ